jgi:predicted ester cyclase
MSSEENKAIFRRMIDGLWNEKKLDVADELFTEGSTSPTAPQLPAGPEGVKQIASTFLAAFPDLQITIDFLVAENDRVFGRLTERATHLGTFFGIAPTGKAVQFTEMGILRIEDGKIAESWYDIDMLGLMGQIMPQQGS